MRPQPLETYWRPQGVPLHERAPVMETFAVDGFPETKLVLALFKNVKNATDLKSKYLNRVALLDAGNTF